ncbi:MAG: hypothetical protein ABI120_07565, partial [Gemmatimonadaceae bacterium]
APFKSDPTPAMGVPIIPRANLEDEFDKARENERAHMPAEDEVIQERKKKAQPVMIALLLLAVTVGLFAVWSLVLKE